MHRIEVHAEIAGEQAPDGIEVEDLGHQRLEKREDVQEVNGQNLTVLNNERGHVSIINQTAYVRDFDVEVAQAAFITDPKIDVIQDGVVLDAKDVAKAAGTIPYEVLTNVSRRVPRVYLER